MSRFPRLFIFTGLVFFSFTYILGSLFFGWTNPLTSIEVSLLVGAIAGLILAALSELIIRLMVFGGCATSLLAGLFAVVGLIMGIAAFFAMLYVPRGDWQKLPQPPEKITQFAGSGSNNLNRQAVYARSADGKLYKLSCTNTSSCSWAEISSIPDSSEAIIPNNTCPAGQGSRYPTPYPPGKVAASYQADVCGAEFTNQYNYIILQDGSLWMWKRSSNNYEPISGLPLFATVGLVLGTACSLLLFVKANRGWWKEGGG